MTLRVSVVVPTYRRDELLSRCLAPLVRQRMDPASYEIIVADDAGCETTGRLVQEFAEGAQTRIRYIKVGPQHGPAAARNAGWRAAQGPIIAFTDDDCVPHDDWLECGLVALGDAAAATGRVIVPLPERPSDYELDCAGLSRAEFVTANCFCRRQVLEAVGGFDERFTAAWREDSDLQFTLLERGHSIVAAPQAIVVHPVRPAPWGISLKQQRKAIFNALLFKKHPQLFRQRIARKPWSYFAAGLALFGTVIAVFMRNYNVAALSAGGWGFLTGLLCARRLRHTSRSPRHVAEMVVTSALIPPLSLYWHLRGAMQYGVFYR